jgi:ATP-dependent DNA helicase RecG
MSTTDDELNGWLNVPREGDLEFKEAKNSISHDKLMEYCVGIANNGGGKLILGVTDAPPREIVGTQAFQNIPDIESKLFVNLKFRVRVEEKQHPNGRVVIFHIPSRSKGEAYNYKGVHWTRVGEELHIMKDEELKAIHCEDKPNWLEEVAQQGCSESEVLELLDYEAFYRLADRPKPSAKDIMAEFNHHRLIRWNGGRFDITNLGGIVLAKDLHSFGLARKAPRVIAYRGLTKVEGAKKDVDGTRGYAVGFEGLRGFIDYYIPENEVFGSALRVSIKMYGERSIRELLANALIHQDFTVDGARVVIEIFSDRIEISNPGKPLIPQDRFLDSVIARNEQLMNVMRHLRIGEARGFGIDNVITESEIYQLPAPDFIQNEIGTTAILYSHREWKEMLLKDKIRACYQHCGLKYIMRQGYMTNKSLRQRFKLPDSEADTISFLIQDTVEAGMIRIADPSAGKKFRQYIPYWAG